MSLGDIGISTINGGAIGVKNAIINGNFAVNQRGVSGTVTLAAGAYGHDRFKAGASGCTYTFATSNNVTTLTISSGSLIQVIEGLNLYSGTYTLSWTGTAQGKIGGGSYSSSGVTGSVTGGSNLNIEFNTGTLSLVQFEQGSVATPFERRPYGTELALCQRYCFVAAASNGYQIGVVRTTNAEYTIRFPVTMRSAPSFSALGLTGYGSSAGNYSVFVYNTGAAASAPVTPSLSCNLLNADTANLGADISSGTAGNVSNIDIQSGLRLSFSAEL